MNKAVLNEPKGQGLFEMCSALPTSQTNCCKSNLESSTDPKVAQHILALNND
ncbi:hypothetical protein [Colwellia sp. 75C3]|uniref:hypothetical protein n=1 Tax=Colwellia sp. 75C3 TaxID=888425 RepID=UPI0012FEF572|nr:hypothetical protein [Colwellia sp. 75C3]